MHAEPLSPTKPSARPSSVDVPSQDWGIGVRLKPTSGGWRATVSIGQFCCQRADKGKESGLTYVQTARRGVGSLQRSI